MKEFYNGLREVCGPQYRGSNQLLASDGETILKEKNQTLNRFAEHFNQLLNIPSSADVSTLDSLMARPIVPSLDTSPQMGEILKAIAATKEGKAPGVCGIPAELWKFGGSKLTEHLHDYTDLERRGGSSGLEGCQHYPHLQEGKQETVW